MPKTDLECQIGIKKAYAINLSLKLSSLNENSFHSDINGPKPVVSGLLMGPGPGIGPDEDGKK